MAERKDIDNGIFSAKGDLLVGTADDTFVALSQPASPTGLVATADPSVASGISWKVPGIYQGQKATQFKYVLESTGDASLTPTKDLCYYVPFPVNKGYTINGLSLGVAVAGGATSVVRLGIFGSGTDGRPSGACIQDYGTIDGTSATYQNASVTASLALADWTLYWVGVTWQVGTVVAGTLRAFGNGNGGYWVTYASNSVDPRGCNYTQSGVTGAYGSVGTLGVPTGINPAVKVRIP